MTTRASRTAAESIAYVLFVLAAAAGLWIGGSFLISPHLDETSLPRRTESEH